MWDKKVIYLRRITGAKFSLKIWSFGAAIELAGLLLKELSGPVSPDISPCYLSLFIFFFRIPRKDKVSGGKIAFIGRNIVNFK